MMHITAMRHHNRIATIDNPPEGGSATEPDTQGKPEDEPRTFTTEEVNAIVQKRLAKERNSAENTELRRKAKLYEEAENANKTELQKLQDQNRKLSEELEQSRHGQLIAAACIRHSIPAEYADLVNGHDEDTIEASAAKIAKLAQAARQPQTTTGATTVPGEGRQPNTNGSVTLDEQIAAAEKEGNTALAIALKSMKLAEAARR